MLVAYTGWGQDPFITTWKTDNPGISNTSSITIPTVFGVNYNYDVDWDNDGVFDETGLVGEVTHDFGAPGIYTIGIRGVFPRIYFNNQGDKEKIINIDQWGDISWSSMHSAFMGAVNLTSDATDAPDLSNVTNMYAMFFGASSFQGDLSNWDVSHVQNMGLLFHGATSFNSDLSNWDVSQVTNMTFMFGYAPTFNSDLSGWDVSQVTDMSYMFHDANLFNSDLSNWDVSKVTDMRAMFYQNHDFNAEIGGWDVSQVTSMKSMFYGANAFNGDIKDWDVSKVESMGLMFEDATVFSGDLSGWDVGKVKNFGFMFGNAIAFNSDISGWDMSSATDMQNMFFRATAFNADIKNWDVSDVTNMTSMFYGATAFNRNLGHWNISKVSEMNDMLALSSLDIINYDSTLVGWASLSPALQQNVTLGAQSLKYCNSEMARNNLINNFGWSIIGDALDCSNLTPNCTVLTNPIDGSINVGLETDLEWSASANTTGYLVSVGTMSGVYDLQNDMDVGNVMTLDLGALQPNTTYFVRITPYNSEGSAIGCPEMSFTTGLENSDYFVTTWKTDNSGAPDNQSISLPIYLLGGENYSYEVDWNYDGNTFNSDGQIYTALDSNVIHHYGAVGIYLVAIKGAFPRIWTGNNFGDRKKIIAVNHWGDQVWSSMAGAFQGCSHLKILADDTPNLSAVTDMSFMFKDADAFDEPVANWDVSHVVKMNGLFFGANSFNQPLGSWDVGQVTNMSSMFQGAKSFNQPLGNWNVSKVTSMTQMFVLAESFNQI